MTGLILAAALAAQAPTAKAEGATRPPKPVAASALVAAPTRPAKASPAKDDDRADANRRMVAKRRAKKSARYAATLDREYREAVAAEKAAEQAKKEYKEMLPYMLENQRQMLQRQSDRERNAALNRLAGAAERSTGYATTGPPPPPRVVNLPGQPLAD